MRRGKLLLVIGLFFSFIYLSNILLPNTGVCVGQGQKSKVIKIANFKELNHLLSGAYTKPFYNSTEGFSWTIDNTAYEFDTQNITTLDVINGALDDYDVLVMVGVHDIQIYCSRTPNKANDGLYGETPNYIKSKLEDFIENGGGYIGHCGGGAFAIELKTIESIYEKIFHTNSFLPGYDGVLCNLHSGIPILSERFYIKKRGDLLIPWPVGTKLQPGRVGSLAYTALMSLVLC